MGLLSALQRTGVVAKPEKLGECSKLDDISVLIRSSNFDIFTLGKRLRQTEKQAAIERRKCRSEFLSLSQIVSGLVHRKNREPKPGLYGLISARVRRSERRSHFDSLLYIIDSYLQWSRSQESTQRYFQVKSTTQTKRSGRFRYSRPRVTFRDPTLIPRGEIHIEVDEEPSENWKVQTLFDMNNSAVPCLYSMWDMEYDFQKVADHLKETCINTEMNISILLPPSPVQVESTDEDAENADENTNAGVVVEDANQSQINFDHLKFAQGVNKGISKTFGRSSEALKPMYGCNLTIFAAYIAIKVGIRGIYQQKLFTSIRLAV